MHCLSRMWWKPNVTQTIFDLHLSGICPSVSVWSRILQHRHTHPAWVLLVYWGYVSVYLSVCTFSCLWVYLLLVIPWMCICTFVCFAPFLDHMSLTVLDIWWPYIYSGSLTELHKPWELLLCRLLWCLWLYIHVCAHVCVCDGEREREMTSGLVQMFSQPGCSFVMCSPSKTDTFKLFSLFCLAF